MSKKAILFDLDGTLVDSAQQIYIAMNLARNNFGYKTLDFLDVQSLLGLPIEFFLTDLQLNKIETQEYVTFFRKVLLESVKEENLLFPGVLELLRHLKSLGVAVGIATSKPSSIARAVVANSSLADVVNFCQGTNGFAPKPNPAVIQYCMREIGVSHAIMVGDRIEDIYAAVAAGIPSIGVAQSAHSQSDLMSAGANMCFDKIENLIDSITQILVLNEV